MAPTSNEAAEYATLANAAYHNGDSESKAKTAGFREVSQEELAGLGVSQKLQGTNGFEARVYERDGHYVVTFRGTDPTSSEDLATDAAGVSAVTAQDRQAVLLATQMKTAVGSEHLSVTGHSLGGRLAALSSVATGVPAVTFDAAGPSGAALLWAGRVGGAKYPESLEGDLAERSWMGTKNPVYTFLRSDRTGRITNYSYEGDALTGAQHGNSVAPEAVGTQVEVANPDKTGQVATVVGVAVPPLQIAAAAIAIEKAVEAHDMTRLERGMYERAEHGGGARIGGYGSNFMIGMDPGAIRKLAVGLDQKAESITRTSTTVDRLVAEIVSQWSGPDSAQFQANWPQHRSTLETLAISIRELAISARRNADAQESVSAEY